MDRVVLDTNVVVSANLSPVGPPAKILNMVFDMRIQLYYSTGILTEYKEVLSRKKLNIAPKTQEDVIAAIEKAGILISPIFSTIPLPDESDRIFYDTAKDSGAILITGNTKHYPAEQFIMTPAEYLDMAIF